MFGLILLGVVTLLHVYVFRHLIQVPCLRRFPGPRGVIGAGVLLWALFAGSEWVEDMQGAIPAFFETAGMNWMGALFLFFVAFLFADIVTFGGWLFRHRRGQVRTAAALAGALMAIVAFVQGGRLPEVATYPVTLKDLPPELDGTKVIVLADTHLGSVLGVDWIQAVIEKIRARQPDLILLAGDIFEDHVPAPSKLTKAFDTLQAPLGVWGVIGNHDDHKNARGLYPIEETGIPLLYNETHPLANGLTLAGVEDLTGHRRGRRKGNPVRKTLETVAEDEAVILLSHAPWLYEDAASAGADLMVAGHGHGGQIWPFGFLVRLHYPLYVGRHAVEDMPLIVSRGAGTWGPRMRLWQRGEIVEIILKSPHKSAQPDTAAATR